VKETNMPVLERIAYYQNRRDEVPNPAEKSD
jgi:hypothetical protein